MMSVATVVAILLDSWIPLVVDNNYVAGLMIMSCY